MLKACLKAGVQIRHGNYTGECQLADANFDGAVDNTDVDFQVSDTKKFKVSDECIGCRACVEVAGDNFEINDDNQAYLKKQPENENEENQSLEAIEVCPVNAISAVEVKKEDLPDAILASSNIKETLDKYPKLKQVLLNLSPKFKRMQNPAMYNTLARFANFNDAAKVTGVSVCEILHTINNFLEVEDKLLKSMPECIKKDKVEVENKSVDISWEESAERYIYNNNSVEELIHKVSGLEPQQNIVIISVEKPNELLKVVSGLNYVFNIEKSREYRISIFNPEKKEEILPWQERKKSFEILDVRTMTSDPFDIIIKKAYENGLIPVIGRLKWDAIAMGAPDRGHFMTVCFCCPCCCIVGKRVHGTVELQNTIQRMEGITVSVDKELCVGCEECMTVCVFHGMEMEDGIAKVNQDRCLGCGRCEQVCPNGAITISLDDPKRIEELICRIEKSVDIS